MTTLPNSSFSRLILAAGALLMTAVMVPAAETRTWTSKDGKTLQATYDHIDGDTVVLKTPDGRTLNVKVNLLSRGDIDYLNDIAPGKISNLPGIGESTTPKKGDKKSPAKEMKIDTKTFVRRPDALEINHQTYKVLESPHFLVMTCGKKAKAEDAAENAERLWHDMDFNHGDFAQKWKDVRMAIFLVEDQEQYDDLGDWYAKMLAEHGHGDDATKVKQTWSKVSSADIAVSSEVAEKYQILPVARVFKIDPKNTKIYDGVWSPFRTHNLAEDMLRTEIGYLSGFGAKGSFWLSEGFAYFKEIQLCGETQTGTAVYDNDAKAGKEVSTLGFKDGKHWPEEVKKIVRHEKDPDKLPKMIDLYGVSESDAKSKNVGLAFSFVRFLQSTPERQEKFAKLTDQINKSSQIPEAADLAKLYGYDDVKKLEGDWITYILSGDFR